MNVKQKLPAGAWRVVALLFFVGTLNYLDRITITTMRSSIIEAIPMTEAQFGLLTSVFLWVYGLLSPFAGFLADKFSRRLVIIVSLFIWSFVTWLTSYATTFEELLATRALMGISEACYIPAALALIMDYHPGPTRSLATGINMCGLMVGSSFGFLGGWIAEAHSWNCAFHIFGIVGIIYSLVLVATLRNAPPTQNQDPSVKQGPGVNLPDATKRLFRNTSFILLLFFWGLLGIVGWMLVGWLPTYYQEHYNLSQGMAGLYATGYFYPASIAGLLLGGFLADRWSRTNERARIIVPVIGLCIAALFVFLAVNVSILPLAIGFFMVFGVTKMFSDANLMPVLCLIADSRYRATGYGILNMFGTVIGGIGLYTAGYMRDMHLNLSILFQFASLILIACAIILFFVKPREAIK